MALIDSTRYSAADLLHWRRLEMYDRRLAGSVTTRGSDAVLALKEFAARTPCYAGTSWGKDSTVLAHLIWRLRDEWSVEIPLIWVRVGPIVNPDCELVRDAFLARWPVEYREIAIQCEQNASGGYSASGTLERGFRAARQLTGASGYASGIRADESAARLLRGCRWGALSPHTCAPLTWWSGRHIFAYMAAHDLPVHPAYACSWGGGLDRAKIRVASLGGVRGTGWGRREWEWSYYRAEMVAIGESRGVVES